MSKIKLSPGVHKVIGVMTGNSLDAVDVGLFEVQIKQATSGNGQTSVVGFREIGFHSVEIGSELRLLIGQVRDSIKIGNGHVPNDRRGSFEKVAVQYHTALLDAINDAIDKFGCRTDVKLVGVHGQTLAHCPPSAGNGSAYAVQLGNGAFLSRGLGLSVVSDFRSDDILNGGEGAPFAPVFNSLLLPSIQLERAFFVNAGNTSNISKVEIGQAPQGFDCGPCNHFVDQLVREETGQAFDLNGEIAAQGMIIPGGLVTLWRTAVVTATGKNGLALNPPRSFDPQWYRLPEELQSRSGHSLPDRLRTVIAFSALCIANGIAFIGQSWPGKVILFGGGWRNKTFFKELMAICDGKAAYVHDVLGEIGVSNAISSLNLSDKIFLARDIGLPDQGMEAGIFAFAAVQRVLDLPFSTPALTGCKAPTKCGLVFTPDSSNQSIPEPWLSRAAPANQAAIS